MSETNETNTPGGETPKSEREPAIPSLFDLVGYSIAAAHATSAASVAQLNVALAAYRLLQVQRASLGVDGSILEEALSGAVAGNEALRRLIRRDGRDTGGSPKMPPTFGTGMPEETLDSAGNARGE